MKQDFDRLERHLLEIKDMLRKMNLTAPSNVPVQKTSDFDLLKGLLQSHDWPDAVEPQLISDPNNESEKQKRAAGIMDFMMERPLEGLSFLDFGCGEGHFVDDAISRGAKLALGFDIKKQWNEKPILTIDWAKIQDNGPYDVVLIHDVLDHVIGNPEDCLTRIKTIVKDSSTIVVRCHPFCSRSATHLYRKVNKAFIHLVFDDMELVRLGLPEGLPIQKVIHPQLCYQRWFENTGYAIAKNYPFTEELEPFFERTPEIAKRIKKHWVTSHEPELASGSKFPAHQLRMQFLDYHVRSY
jgi:2-polyprenyl-3-methyl-5-hydroxy-6-metoxy-1,4-benzoquinol methylase